MRPATKRHSVILEDGKTSFIGTVSEIYTLIKKRVKTNITQTLIYDRVYQFGKKGPIPIAKLLADPETAIIRTQRAVEYSRSRAQRFDGVEGFDELVSALEVWEEWIGKKGKNSPTKHTIFNKLIEGYRDKKDLLHLNCKGARKKEKPAVRKSAVEPIKVSKPIIDWDLDSLKPPPPRFIVVQPVWSQGGKPFFRPGALDPWPELKIHLLGE